MPYRRYVRGMLRGAIGLIWLGLAILPGELFLPATAHAQQPPSVQGTLPDSTASQQQTTPPATGQAPPSTARQGTATPSVAGQQPVAQTGGSVSGTVVDQTGALAIGAKVQLTHDDKTPAQEIVSGDYGEYSFSGVPAGPFHITASSQRLYYRNVSPDN